VADDTCGHRFAVDQNLDRGEIAQLEIGPEECAADAGFVQTPFPATLIPAAKQHRKINLQAMAPAVFHGSGSTRVESDFLTQRVSLHRYLKDDAKALGMRGPLKRGKSPPSIATMVEGRRHP